ncbi:MAG: SOS response-associated peptidase family protein [Beijerinckiaceae bacterium]
MPSSAAPRKLRPRYIIAPTTMIAGVRLDKAGRRELVSMRWGAIPFFGNTSLNEIQATFHARREMGG